MAKVSNLLLFIGLAMLAIAAGLNTYSGYAPADPNSTPLFSRSGGRAGSRSMPRALRCCWWGWYCGLRLKAARIKDYHFSTAEPATAIIDMNNYIDHHRQHNCG